MKGETAPTCATCVHFKVLSAVLVNSEAVCRRYPPVPLVVPDGRGAGIVVSDFTRTQKDSVCGEHNPRPPRFDA